MDLQVYFIFTLFASYHLSLHCSQSAPKDVLEARCTSRCYSEVLHGKECTKSSECLSCLRPCKTKQQGLPCFIICGPNVMNTTICRKSCTFIKHLQIEDKNLSCPPEVSRNECYLMVPEDVQIVETTGNVSSPAVNITIHGSWPSSTVFVIGVQEMKKIPKREKDLPLWMTDNLYQTTSHSLVIKLQSLYWYRFRVAAVNQYGMSMFSQPSDIYYAKPRKPEPPWNFQVQFMQVNEGAAEVSLSWKKPKRIDPPIHRYKLGWSKRLDRPSEDFMLITFKIVRIQSNVHMYMITGLQLNTTYVLELQAVSRVGRERLRSKWVYLTIRTPASNKKMKWDSKVDLKENSSSGSNQSGSSIPSVRKETPLHTTQDTSNFVKQTGSSNISRSRSHVLSVSASMPVLVILVLWHPV